MMIFLISQFTYTYLGYNNTHYTVGVFMHQFIGIMLFFYLVTVIPLTYYLDNKFINSYQSNRFVTTLTLFISIFANPLTVIISFLVAGSFFDGLSQFDYGITSFNRIILFVCVACVITFLRFLVWSYENYNKILITSFKSFTYRAGYQAPFLLFTCGLFQYWNKEFTVPTISLLLLFIAMFYTFFFSFLKR